MGVTGYKNKTRSMHEERCRGYSTNKLVRETRKIIRHSIDIIKKMTGETRKGAGKNI